MGHNSDRKVLFKTSISGYKKEHVNEYIESENRRFAELEASYNKAIDELKADIENASSEIERLKTFEDAASAAEAKLSEAKNEIAILNEKLKDAETAADESSRRLSETDNMVKALQSSLNTKSAELEAMQEKFDILSGVAEKKDSEISELSAANESQRTALEEAKAEISRIAKELESRSEIKNRESDTGAETDTLLVRARAATEDMLKRAEAGAEVILDKARKEALDYRGEIFAAAKEVFTAATEELRRSIGICMSDFVSGIRTAKNDAARANDTSVRCEDDLSRRIERMQNDLDRAIAEKLAEFDSKR